MESPELFSNRPASWGIPGHSRLPADTDAVTTSSRNPLMQEVFRKIRTVAPTGTSVLLTGETGTGKGMIARLIHRLSRRPEDRFVAVHCGTVPDSLIESELFGHERGAFTGAVRRKLGQFEIAGKGTIFLDEIGTVSPALQVKLLHVLQERTFQRVGGEQTLQCHARIIAAANVDLRALCETGHFRRDLYYRLSVFPVELPPLRRRMDDLVTLMKTFLNRFNRMYSRNIGLPPEPVLYALQRYAWPGNIRELENLVERACLLATGDRLTAACFPAELFLPRSAAYQPVPDSCATLAEVRRQGLANIESAYLRELLSLHNGRLNRAARTAGITSRRLYELMKKYDLKKETFKTKKQELLDPEKK